MHPGWPSPAFVCRDRGRRELIRQTTHVEARSGATRDGGSIPPASTSFKGSVRLDILPADSIQTLGSMGGIERVRSRRLPAEGGSAGGNRIAQWAIR